MKRAPLSPTVGLLLGLLLSCADVLGQPKPSCTAAKTGKPAALTAREAWELAGARAHEWQADSVPFQFTTTSVAPLDAEGRSTDWEISFSSAKARPWT